MPDIDMILLDYNEKHFKLARKLIKTAIERDIYFEVSIYFYFLIIKLVFNPISSNLHIIVLGCISSLKRFLK